jgi:glycolate oxidase FAD binding subunit
MNSSMELQASIKEAYENKTPLNIIGNNTKSFYGSAVNGETISVANHSGVIDYEPAELVLTARAGTPLSVIEKVLNEQGQFLAFEPPYFGENATLGGTIACGFSGPRRAYVGAARDFVLGIQAVNGKGEILKFGGQVMKNVAGYDISRLMVGALGTLGVLLEISLKVLPKPKYELTLALELDIDTAISKMNSWAGQAIPLSATAYVDDKLYVRLSGTESGVKKAQQQIGGEQQADKFWQELREHKHSFFQTQQNLWRLSLAPATKQLNLPGQYFIDWSGAQRWLITDAPADEIRAAVNAVNGHATLFRSQESNIARFHSLPPALAALHSRIKHAFDPENILNRDKLN